MKKEDFKCPYCGSTHYEHVFPKDKTIPVFLRRCAKCGKYQKCHLTYDIEHHKETRRNSKKLPLFEKEK